MGGFGSLPDMSSEINFVNDTAAAGFWRQVFRIYVKNRCFRLI